MGRKFNIKVECNFEYLWRYNITLACEMCNASGERVDYGYVERRIGDIGCNMLHQPADWKNESLELATVECDQIRVLLYVNPHTMPRERDVEALPPFPMRVCITADRKSLYDKSHEVDQRGGTSVSVEL